jgi:hypothetical protein
MRRSTLPAPTRRLVAPCGEPKDGAMEATLAAPVDDVQRACRLGGTLRAPARGVLGASRQSKARPRAPTLAQPVNHDDSLRRAVRA